MNRAEKRQLVKTLQTKGLSREQATTYAERTASKTQNLRAAWEGEKVKLDVAQLMSYKEWKDKTYDHNRKAYQEWVLTHAGEVFTVELDPARKGTRQQNLIVQLQEDATSPKWLFWAGDLIPEREQPLLEQKRREQDEQEQAQKDEMENKIWNATEELLRREQEG